MMPVKEVYKLRGRVVTIPNPPADNEENPQRTVEEAEEENDVQDVHPQRIYPPGFKKISFDTGDWLWISPCLQLVKNARERPMVFPGTEGEHDPDSKAVGSSVAMVIIGTKNKGTLSVKAGSKLNLQPSIGYHQPLTELSWLQNIGSGFYFKSTPDEADTSLAVPDDPNVVAFVMIEGIAGQLRCYRADTAEVIEPPASDEHSNNSVHEAEDLPLHLSVGVAADAHSGQDVADGSPLGAQNDAAEDASLSTEYLSAVDSAIHCEHARKVEANDEPNGAKHHGVADVGQKPKFQISTPLDNTGSSKHTIFQPLCDLSCIPQSSFPTSAFSKSHSTKGKREIPPKELSSQLSTRHSFSPSDSNQHRSKQEKVPIEKSNSRNSSKIVNIRAQPPNQSGKWNSRNHQRNAQKRLNKKLAKMSKSGDGAKSIGGVSDNRNESRSSASLSIEITESGSIKVKLPVPPGGWITHNQRRNAERRVMKKVRKTLTVHDEKSTGESQSNGQRSTGGWKLQPEPKTI